MLMCTRAVYHCGPATQMVRTELDRIRLAEEAARLRAQLAEERAADANARAITEAHRAEQRVRDVMATMASERDAAVSLRGWGEGQCWVWHPLEGPAGGASQT